MYNDNEELLQETESSMCNDNQESLQETELITCKDETKQAIYLLQSNMKPIRQIANWTAQQLGEKIGVSKQTISNLENMKTPMSLTQYIAIRTILDYEIRTNKDNCVLPDIVSVLLDREEEPTEEDNAIIQKAVQVVASSAAAGVSGETLESIFDDITEDCTVSPRSLTSCVSIIPKSILVNRTNNWLKKLLDQK